MKKKLLKFMLLWCMIIGMAMTAYAEDADETTDDVQQEEVTDDTKQEEDSMTLEAPVVTLKQVAKGVKLSWKSVEGAVKYEVYRKAGTADWSEKPFFTTKQCYYINTSVKYGTTYSYKVKAVGEDGQLRLESEFSEVKTRKVGLAKPENLVVERNTHSSVKLTWNKNTPATGYEIYRATSKNGTYKKVKTIAKASTLSYVDTGLTIGKTYYYKIRAVYNAKKGSFSSIVSGKVALMPPVMKTTSYVTSSSVQVRWNKSASAQGYYVYRKTANGSWKKIATVKGASTTSYKDTTAKQGYYYAVKAYRSVNGKIYTSNRSYSVYARVLKTPTLKISQLDGKKQVKISWGKVSNATSYRIYKKTGLNGSWAYVKSVSADTLSYTAKIPTGKTVYWKVRAVNASSGKYSYSAYSNVKYETIWLPELYMYMDETCVGPSMKEAEYVMFGIVNASKGKMRVYTKDAQLKYDQTDEDGSGINYSYRIPIYLADYETETAIDYLDVPVIKGEVDESEIALPVFIVDGEAPKFYEDTEVQFIFRYDGLYYKAYLTMYRLQYEEIEKPQF